MEFFKVVSVDDARELIKDEFGQYQLESELVSLLESQGRVLSDDIVSEINVPEFDRSTVDGYAVLVEDSHGATESIPSILEVLGEVLMGETPKHQVGSGQAVYVPTGGMMPEGATGMIMIENTEKMDEETVLLFKPISKGENMVFRGEDIKKGEVALQAGRRIGPNEIGVLASLGISHVRVIKKPKVYILSTGDEVIDLDEELKIGKIRDINSYALSAMIREIGGEVAGREIVKDNYNLLLEGVRRALQHADVVLLSGGSSVGTRDYTHKVITDLKGKGVLAHGISIKPGKPTIIGDGKGKLIVGLPGHPVSSIVVFKAIVQPYIQGLLKAPYDARRVEAITTHNFPSSPGKETYHMVRLKREDGKMFATPSFGKSGMITLLSSSDGYIVIAEHEEGINKGETREVYLF
ncbi:molybdopterin molybdotransferase MoeA [Gudongella sp. SC589]|jgi:molybdopterin molybdotransferase|uniref:molybdopterin molybdotransferase MoeA n=1 Tax=Gudongella sp. SC589 TaxID=3385990 RepID=UPI0039049FEE